MIIVYTMNLTIVTKKIESKILRNVQIELKS